MAFEERHLIWKAIVALDEVCEQSFQAPIPPTFALRFILAYLFARSDGNRTPFDAFWKACQEPEGGMTQQGYRRGCYTRTQWNGIVRGLGIAQTIEFNASIARARRGSNKAKSGVQ